MLLCEVMSGHIIGITFLLIFFLWLYLYAASVLGYKESAKVMGISFFMSGVVLIGIMCIASYIINVPL